MSDVNYYESFCDADIVVVVGGEVTEVNNDASIVPYGVIDDTAA